MSNTILFGDAVESPLLGESLPFKIVYSKVASSFNFTFKLGGLAASYDFIENNWFVFFIHV